MPDKPSDFDWVSERHACSATLMFELLYLQAKSNTERMNALAKERGLRGDFQITGRSDSFSVLRQTFGRSDVVRFNFHEEEFEVEAQSGLWGFKGSLTLNDEGECRFLVDGKELNLWQVLRRALEPLFFGATPGAT